MYKKNSELHLKLIIAVTFLMFTTGCSYSDATRVEEDFGVSVRQMVKEQLYDPAAASEPAVSGPDILDGETINTTINEYREAAKKPKAE